jgi:ParB family chromosome partitioning protein
MTDITMIALSKLVESEDNVRRSNRKGGIGELAASIRSHGLLASLCVLDNGKGKFAVIAGGRRLRALRLLAKGGDLEKNALIPCRIVSAEEATELSLAENVVRVRLEAHDEIVAVAKLADEGLGVETIASRFGVSPQHVARRLKLSRVSPRLIEALKKEEATLDQLAALAVVDDHVAQEKAFFDAPDWARTPERLKAQVMQAHVSETDKLARFVGLDAYQAAGGAIVSDLFADADDDGARYLADRDLLVRLAEAKLQPIAAEVRAEGWAWTEIAIDGVAWSQFPDRVRERRRELSAEDSAEQDCLYAQLDETEDEAEIERIEEAIDALVTAEWNADEVALAGAIITLAHSGEPKVERGLVRADDVKAVRAVRRKHATSAEAGDGNTSHAAAVSPKPRLPAKLVDELMAHKTLALRAELATQPDLALRLVVFALAAEATSGQGPLSLVRVRIDQADVSKLTVRSESKAAAHYHELLDAWRERLPADAAALWAFVAAADMPILLDLLAVLAAPAIELRAGCGELIAGLLCQAAHLDMSKWWSATTESYFDHVRKDVVIDAMMEINPALDRSKLDKGSKKDVLARVKKAFKDKGWLPEPLRGPAPAAPAEAAIAAE